MQAEFREDPTFVLEAIEGKLLQELLPWLMLSEKFTRHSVQESKGSTNPYINFPDIAKFEFDLPPFDQQRHIAEILWAVDETENSYYKLKASTDAAFRANAANLFPSIKDSSVRFIELEKLCVRQPQSGLYKGPAFLGRGTKSSSRSSQIWQQYEWIDLTARAIAVSRMIRLIST